MGKQSDEFLWQPFSRTWTKSWSSSLTRDLAKIRYYLPGNIFVIRSEGFFRHYCLGIPKQRFPRLHSFGLWMDTGRKSTKRAVHRRNSSCARLPFPLSIPDTHSQTSTTEMPRNKKRLLENNPLLQSSVLSSGLLFFAFLIFSRQKPSSDFWASHIRLRVFWDFAERQTYARNCEDPWLE